MKEIVVATTNTDGARNMDTTDEHIRKVTRSRPRFSLREYIGAATIVMLAVGLAATAYRLRQRESELSRLHRQLGYPEVPKPEPPDETEALLPQLARRIELLEKRVTLVEEEQRGGFDLTKFYGQGPTPPGPIGPDPTGQ